MKDTAEQGTEVIADYREELLELHEWSGLDRFDRRSVNEHLQQYVNGDKAWMFTD